MYRSIALASVWATVRAGALICAPSADASHTGGEGHSEGIDVIYPYIEASVAKISLSDKPIDRIDVLLISGHDSPQKVENILVGKEFYVEIRPLIRGTYDLRVQLHSTSQLLAECDLVVGESCTVLLLPGEGTGTECRSEVMSGSLYTVPECTFEAPEGLVFSGWSSDGTVHAAGDQVTVVSDMEFTATYSPDSVPDGQSGMDPGMLVLIASVAVTLVAIAAVVLWYARKDRRR